MTDIHSSALQLPAGAEEMYPAALNLIQGILISTPSARVKMSGIMQHPWFTAKLPPGATLLNEAYLSMGQANGKPIG